MSKEGVVVVDGDIGVRVILRHGRVHKWLCGAGANRGAPVVVFAHSTCTSCGGSGRQSVDRMDISIALCWLLCFSFLLLLFALCF